MPVGFIYPDVSVPPGEEALKRWRSLFREGGRADLPGCVLGCESVSRCPALAGGGGEVCGAGVRAGGAFVSVPQGGHRPGEARRPRGSPGLRSQASILGRAGQGRAEPRGLNPRGC